MTVVTAKTNKIVLMQQLLFYDHSILYRRPLLLIMTQSADLDIRMTTKRAFTTPRTGLIALQSA